MKIRKGSTSELILLALEKSADGLVRFTDFAYNSHSYAYGGRSGYPLGKSVQIISYLREYDVKSKGVESNTDHGGLMKELMFKILH